VGGDIKVQNILIDHCVRPNFADFGLSFKSDLRKLLIQFLGSREFAAREIFDCVAYDPFRSDIWSLGVTFYWMVTGESSWPRSSLAFRTMPLKVAPFFKLM
jgi:serine/threonine protein kinase